MPGGYTGTKKFNIPVFIHHMMCENVYKKFHIFIKIKLEITREITL